MDRSPCNRRLGIASQEHAGRVVSQLDGNQVVVGLAKEFAERWRDDASMRTSDQTCGLAARVQQSAPDFRQCCKADFIEILYYATS